MTYSHEEISTLRLTYLPVYKWVGEKHEKHVCVDLIVISPLVRLRTRDFIVGHTSLKVSSSKLVKYKKKCSENQHAFISFAFDTFVFLASETIYLLQRVLRLMHYNVTSLRAMNVFIK